MRSSLKQKIKFHPLSCNYKIIFNFIILFLKIEDVLSLKGKLKNESTHLKELLKQV